MWLNNLRKLFFTSRSTGTAHRRPGRPPRHARLRPQLEVLEDRLAPAGIEGVTATMIPPTSFTVGNFGGLAGQFGVAAADWGDGSIDTTGVLVTASGVYTVNGSHLDAEEGTYNYSITLTNGGGLSAAITGSATVGDAALTGSSAATATGGVEAVTPATLSGASFSDTNTGAPASDFTVTAANWGDGADTTGLTVAGSGGSYTVAGSHLYVEEGAYNFSITVTDDGGQTAVITSSTTVADPAVTATATSVQAVEGTPLTNVVLATFTDPGGAEPNGNAPGGIADHYQVVSIDWGDGTPLDTTSGAISFSGAPGSTTDSFTVTGSHAYAEELSGTSTPTHTITVIISHEGTSATTNGGMAAPVTVTSTATLSDPAVIATGGLTLAATAGVDSSSQVVATFTDPGGPECRALWRGYLGGESDLRD